jgi:hypothetical protein
LDINYTIYEKEISGEGIEISSNLKKYTRIKGIDTIDLTKLKFNKVEKSSGTSKLKLGVLKLHHYLHNKPRERKFSHRALFCYFPILLDDKTFCIPLFSASNKANPNYKKKIPTQLGIPDWQNPNNTI